MEGGLLIHAAWLLSFTFVFFYRRYFETVAPRDAAFEASCRSRPVLAALCVTPGAEAEVAAKLRVLVPRGEVIATLGGWPWIHYVLRVEQESARGTLLLRIAGARVLRSREPRPPTVTLLLDALRREAPGLVTETWLHEGVYLDVTGRLAAPHGWRLAPGGGARPVLEAWPAPPEFALGEDGTRAVDAGTVISKFSHRWSYLRLVFGRHLRPMDRTAASRMLF